MLYESAARADEILALNVEQLDLESRRAPIRSKGGEIAWVYWGTGTAHLLPRLRLPDGASRASGPLFLASHKPVPARRPAPSDVCPHTGHARLGYDRARILLRASTGWQLHQLRHATTTEVHDRGSETSFGSPTPITSPTTQKIANTATVRAGRKIESGTVRRR